VRVTATEVAGYKGARPGRGGLTGEPLGVSRRTGWGARLMAEGVAATKPDAVWGNPEGTER
jgi:hypothetical protein